MNLTQKANNGLKLFAFNSFLLHLQRETNATPQVASPHLWHIIIYILKARLIYHRHFLQGETS